MAKGIIYNTPVENINKKKFRLYVPESYDPLIPEYYTKHGLEPAYQPIEGVMSISYMTIADMIDMCVNDVGFSMSDPEDVEFIILQLKMYLQDVRKLNKRPSPELEDFVQSCSKTLAMFRKAQQTIDTRNKSKAILRGDQITPKDMFESLSEIGL